MTKIFIPTELSGLKCKAIFEIAHRNAETTIFWHLNNIYIGETKISHRKEINPSAGTHKMTLVDNQGETLIFNFEIIE